MVSSDARIYIKEKNVSSSGRKFNVCLLVTLTLKTLVEKPIQLKGKLKVDEVWKVAFVTCLTNDPQ